MYLALTFLFCIRIILYVSHVKATALTLVASSVV